MFDENLIKEYNPVKERPKEYDKCPICGKDKLKVRKYCSKSCSAKAQERVDWSKYDIVYWIDNKIKSIYQIANELDISFAAVKKRYKKLKKSS